MSADETEVSVVIVGGGPIGLTLSYMLGKNNIQHVVLEQNETTSKWPKAMLTNPRSMELYRRLGLDACLRDQALDGGLDFSLMVSMINDPPVLRGGLAQLMGKNPHEQEDGTITFDQQWSTEKVCRLSQIYMEPILKAECSKHESSDIKFGWKVQSVSQTQENVRVEAVNVTTGEQKVYRAQYAVGCDGGKSFVRKSLDIHFKGMFDLAHFKSITFTSPEYKKRLTTRSMIASLIRPGLLQLNLLVQLDEEGLFVVHFNIEKDIEREAEELMGLLMDNEDIPYTILSEKDWQGHFAAAETLQDGRVFLAGDACHVVIPVGGFGMNTGILDAYDLGWKLVGTIKGWGGQRLLASYTPERHHGIEKVVERITILFSQVKNYSSLLVFLFNTRPFKYIMKLFIDPMNMPAAVTGILFGVRLDTSPLCIPSSLPLPPVHPLHYTPIAHPGCRAPHFQFQDGTTLYDKLGSVFTLLHLHPSNKNYDPILAAAAHCGIPLKVVSFNDRKLKRLYRGMDFVIIRPDLYVAWCGNEIPTLLHNEDINEGARVLMKVITGAEVLPPEWRQKQKVRIKITPVWYFPAITAMVGISVATVAALRHFNYIN